MLDVGNLGNRIRERRLERSLSLTRLGQLLGVDKTTVRSWETGRSTPRQANAIRIMEWLAEPMSTKSGDEKVKDVVRCLKKKRLSLGWSQVRLVRHLSVGKNRVYEWEKGRSQPGAGSLKKIEQWLSENV